MSDDRNTTGNDSEKLLYCSFCGKSQHEVKNVPSVEKASMKLRN